MCVKDGRKAETELKLLAICNTPYQIICAVNLKKNKFADDEMDIIISDHMNNVRSLEENIRATALFRNVFVVESFKYCRRKEKYAGLGYRLGFGNRILKEMLNLQERYDVLLLSNVDPFADRVYERCVQLNKGLQVYAFEDGYGTYVYYGKTIEGIQNVQEKRTVMKLLRLLGRRRVALHIDRLFLYSPSKLEWKLDFPLEQMPALNSADEELRRVLNAIFAYDKNKDDYRAKYIFFEESYRKEGMVLPDVLLVELVASWVGKENIIVKTHPRSGCELFEELGYAVNRNTAIPWELVWMNEKEMRERVLLSISSGSISTGNSLFGEAVQAVPLHKLLFGIGNIDLNEYHRWLERNIYEKNQNMFFVPETLEELRTYLTERA